MLKRPDLERPAAKRTLAASLAWLEQHVRSAHADFVFTEVIRSRRSSPDIAREAAIAALEWLEHVPAERRGDLHFTLSTLLRHARVIDDARLSVVVDRAIRWLQEERPDGAGDERDVIDLSRRRSGSTGCRSCARSRPRRTRAGPPLTLPPTVGTSRFASAAQRRAGGPARDTATVVPASFLRAAMDAARKQSAQKTR